MREALCSTESSLLQPVTELRWLVEKDVDASGLLLSLSLPLLQETTDALFEILLLSHEAATTAGTKAAAPETERSATRNAQLLPKEDIFLFCSILLIRCSYSINDK
jgi:hypothetical protein